MTKIEAVQAIINDARTERSSKASLKRLRTAMKALDLSDSDKAEIETRLEYRDWESGELYTPYADKK